MTHSPSSARFTQLETVVGAHYLVAEWEKECEGVAEVNTVEKGGVIL